MEGKERRERLLEILKNSSAPVSGSELSKQLGVSRQVIVQDIALLRRSIRIYYQRPRDTSYTIRRNKK